MSRGEKKPRVLIIRFGAIGNALVAVPAIRALRRAWPEAYLALAGDPITLELLKTCPYLDELIRYDFHGPEAFPFGYARFIAELRKRRFTHSLHFKRHLRSELIGLFSGAKVRVGFEDDQGGRFLTVKVPYREGESVVEQNLELVRALGLPAEDSRLEYWPTRGSRKVAELISDAKGSGPLVVIHPGGKTQRERLWNGYPELARMLRKELDAKIVMIGAENERDLVMETARALNPPAAAAVGLPLPELAELIQQADLFAGTDSGPAHIASALDKPGAVIYAPHLSLEAQLKKWKTGWDMMAFGPSRSCLECKEHPCPPDRQKECANNIPADAVAEEMIKLYLGEEDEDDELL